MQKTRAEEKLDKTGATQENLQENHWLKFHGKQVCLVHQQERQ
jgi:hypothetical protein